MDRGRAREECSALNDAAGKEPGRPNDLHAWMVSAIPRAVAYATGLLYDRERAEDVVHDCCCRLLEKAAEYDLPRDGMRLLFKSITNACFTANTRIRPVLSLDAFMTGGSDSRLLADTRAREPEHTAMCKELEQAVGEGLARLPPMQRAALELASLGHSQQEVADVLETTPGNVRVLVHRARQAMADYLSPFTKEATG